MIKSIKQFSRRYRLAQQIQKANRGILMIGNSRVGKSTLACAMAGADMQYVFKDNYITYLHPIDPKFEGKVLDQVDSVTEVPNFYNMGANKPAIIDLPGLNDSCQIRQIINIHYIRTILKNIKQVRFLMVINLQQIGDSYNVSQKDCQMMISFSNYFPQAKSAINIIINRIYDGKLKLEKIKNFFRMWISEHKNQDIRFFYGDITNQKILVVEKPRHVLNNEGKANYSNKVLGRAVKSQMKQIYEMNSKYIKINQNNINPNPWKNIYEQDKKFSDSYIYLVNQLKKKIEQFQQLRCKTYLQNTKYYINEIKSFNVLQQKVKQYKKQYSISRQIKNKQNQQPKKYHLIEYNLTSILNNIVQLTQIQKTLQENNLQPPYIFHSSQFNIEVIKFHFSSIFDSILQLNSKQGNNQLNMYFQQIKQQLLQNLQQLYFLSTILFSKKLIIQYQQLYLKLDLKNTMMTILSQVYLTIFDINPFMIEQDKLIYKKLSDKIINIKIKDKFSKYITKQQRQQLIQSLHIIKNLYQKFQNDKNSLAQIYQKIKKKITQIQIYQPFIIGPNPIILPKSQRVPLKKLFQSFNNLDVKMKPQIVYRISLYDQLCDQDSAILFFKLKLYQLAFNKLKIIIDKFPQEVCTWCLCFCKLFKQEGQFQYSRKCLQLIKPFLINFNLSYENKNFQLSSLKDFYQQILRQQQSWKFKNEHFQFHMDSIENQIMFIGFKLKYLNKNFKTESIIEYKKRI